MAGVFDRQVGGRHARCRHEGFQREVLAGSTGQADNRSSARHRAVPPEGFRHLDRWNTNDDTNPDTNAYTRPWTFTEHVRLLTDTELMEAICNENNRDLEHLPSGNLR